MERVQFFNGQLVSTNDLDTLQSDAMDNIKYRTTVFSPGIDGDVSDYIEVGSDDTLNIKALTAYDSSGERIYISSDLEGYSPDDASPITYPMELISQTPGTTHWTPDTTYTIVIDYTETDDVLIPHPITGSFHYTRKVAGYTLYALRKGVDPVLDSYITLADVVYSSSTSTLSVDTTVTEYYKLLPNKVSITIPSDISASRPSTYTLGQIKSLADHINSIGHGTISAYNPHGLNAADAGFTDRTIDQHEQLLHTSGIIGNQDSTVSSLYGLVNWVTKTGSTYDSFIIKGLTSSEYVEIYGDWVDYESVTGNWEFRFTDTLTVLPNGTYIFFIDSIDKTLKLASVSDVGLGYNYVIVNSEGSTTYQVVSEASSALNTSLRLWAVTWVQTPATSTVPEVNVVPADGTSNFTSKTDLRYFGTLKSDNLYRDSLTNTITITHNIASTKKIQTTDEFSLTSGSPTKNTSFNLPERHTILSGSTDSSGHANFLSSSGFDISISASTDNLILAFAHGFNIYGPIDYVEGIIADISDVWTVAPSTTSYLYVSRTSAGVLSYGFTTIAPIYSVVEPSHLSGQYWFDINKMKMYLSDGASWTVVDVLFLGESISDGSSITTLTSYAIRSQYDSGWFSISSNTGYAKTHNIGTQPFNITLFGATSSVGANMGMLEGDTGMGDGTADGVGIGSITNTSLALRTTDISISGTFSLWTNGASGLLPTYARIYAKRGW